MPQKNLYIAYIHEFIGHTIKYPEASTNFDDLKEYLYEPELITTIADSRHRFIIMENLAKNSDPRSIWLCDIIGFYLETQLTGYSLTTAIGVLQDTTDETTVNTNKLPFTFIGSEILKFPFVSKCFLELQEAIKNPKQESIQDQNDRYGEDSEQTEPNI